MSSITAATSESKLFKWGKILCGIGASIGAIAGVVYKHRMIKHKKEKKKREGKVLTFKLSEYCGQIINGAISGSTMGIMWPITGPAILLKLCDDGALITEDSVETYTGKYINNCFFTLGMASATQIAFIPFYKSNLDKEFLELVVFFNVYAQISNLVKFIRE